MKVLKSINAIRSFVQKEKLKSLKIGFVPTMGALHEGHLKMVNTAKNENDLTIVSIFINPTQFNRKEDYIKYPITISRDIELLEAEGTDVLFLPNNDEMYPNDESLKFSFGYMEDLMEGEFRPGHFSGVGLVVSKFFNIIQPDRAYFGEKDLQQLIIIKKLVKDINIDVQIRNVPTIRETSGLAMSSRNLRLTTSEKEIATNIYKGLKLAKKYLETKRSVLEARELTLAFFEKVNGLKFEYLEVVETNTLLPIKEFKKNQRVSICIAAFVGGVRLIDNISFTI